MTGRRTDSRFRLRFYAGYIAAVVAADWLTYLTSGRGVLLWAPGTGLMVALLLAAGVRSTWAFVAAVVVVRLTHPETLTLGSVALSAIVSGLLYLSIAAAVARFSRFDPSLRSHRDVGLVAAVVVLGPLLFRFVLAALAPLVGRSYPTGDSLVHRWLADSIGGLSIAPFVLSHWGERLRPRPAGAVPSGRSTSEHHWLELGIALIASVLFVIVDLQPATSQFRTSYFLVLPVAWLALRFNLRGATAGILVTNAAYVLVAFALGSHQTPVADRVFLVGLDLAGLFLGTIAQARGQVEARLAESERRCRLLTENSFEVIAVITDRGVITYASPSTESVLGYRPEDLMGEPIDSMVHPDDVPQLRNSIAALFSGLAPQRGTYRVRCKDRRYVWIERTARVLIDPDAAAGDRHYIITLRDVSDRQVLEESLRQSQKLESVGRLAGGVAHDFNNLLTAILGHASLIEDDPETPAVIRGSVVEIRRAGERAAALTGQLLAFARRQVAEPRVLVLIELAEGMERLLHRGLGEDIRLVTRYAPDLWPVRVDPGQIEQVILNLAVNARDALPDGGELRIEIDNVVVRESQPSPHPELTSGQYVAITVRDDGQGMDSKVLSQIFEPFFTTKEVGKGTGLGLAMCHGIVRQSGGQITVESAVGQGATFRIYLPRSRETPGPARTAASAQRSVGGGEMILVVEDESQVRELAGQVLRNLGYEVLLADSAESAIALAATHRGRLHALIADVVMPGLSGPKLARQLVAAEPGLRVLFMSGFPERAEAGDGEGFALGDFLGKPFTPAQLASRVRALLGEAREPVVPNPAVGAGGVRRNPADTERG